MLTRNEEKIAKSERMKVFRLSDDLINSEGGPEDGVVPRESTVTTIVHTFVRKVERGKEAHGSPKLAT